MEWRTLSSNMRGFNHPKIGISIGKHEDSTTKYNLVGGFNPSEK